MAESRKGYKNPADQVEANKRYLNNNPEARQRKRICNTRSSARKFLKEYMTLEEVEEFQKLIAERVEQLKNA